MANSARAARLMKAFGKRLRIAREQFLGIKYAGDFAKLLEIDGQRYRKYDRGEAFPPLDVLENIIDRTGVSADWLLFQRGPVFEDRAKGKSTN